MFKSPQSSQRTKSNSSNWVIPLTFWCGLLTSELSANQHSSEDECDPTQEICENDADMGLFLLSLLALASGGGAVAASQDDGDGSNAAPVISNIDMASVMSGDTFVADYDATDPDNGPLDLSFSIVGGEDASLFQIDEDTGELSFINPPDVDAPNDVGNDNDYEVTVSVSDGIATTEQTVTVTVTCSLEVMTESDGTGIGSLRDAIICANTNENGEDTIELAAGNYTLTEFLGDDSLTSSGDLDIYEDLIIRGSDKATTVIDASDLGFMDRVFEIDEGVTLTLENLTITGGSAGSILAMNSNLVLSNVDIVDGIGGSALTFLGSSTANMNNSIISGNNADGFSGGAIFAGNTSNVTVTESFIAQNFATNGGGVAVFDSATFNLIDSEIFDNDAVNGGGMYNQGMSQATISNTNISDNVATERGGGIYTIDGAQVELNTQAIVETNTATIHGGGIFIESGEELVASVTVDESSVRFNNAINGNGGGIYGLDAGIELMGGTLNNNMSGSVGGGLAVSNGNLDITGTTVSENVGVHAGGIDTNRSYVNIKEANIINNESTSTEFGVGGISLFKNHLSEIEDTTIDGNISAAEAGGIKYSPSHEDEFSGDYIFSSTISNNTAATDGGGIWAKGLDGAPLASLNIYNVTVSGNEAEDNGAGLYLSSEIAGVAVFVYMSTITDNTLNSGSIGGAGIASPFTGANLQIQSTIVAQNTNDDDIFGEDINSLGNNIFGNIDNGDYTLLQGFDHTGSTIAPFQAGIDDLNDNGGPTMTHALLINSPAIDSGIAAPDISHDQRGQDRSVDLPVMISIINGDGITDVGAFELQQFEYDLFI